MTPLRSRIAALPDNQRDQLLATWSSVGVHLDSTDPAEVARAMAHIDATLGYDEAEPLEQMRQRVAATVSAAADDDRELITAIVERALGTMKAPSQMDADECSATIRCALDLSKGRLAAIDDGTGHLVLVGARAIRHRIRATRELAEMAEALGKAPHPNDERHGAWRAVVALHDPTGNVQVVPLVGPKAVDLAAAVVAQEASQMNGDVT